MVGTMAQGWTSGSNQKGLPGSHDSAVAEFVANGFVAFDGVMSPDEIERIAELEGELPYPAYIRDALPSSVVSIVCSLIGGEWATQRLSVHDTQPGLGGQPLHVDAALDSRGAAFDVQLMMLPQRTSVDMGATRLIPRSHLWRANNSNIARYRFLKGQVYGEGSEGTVYLVHSRLWHSGRKNSSVSERRMVRLRLGGNDAGGSWVPSPGFLNAPERMEAMFRRSPWEDSTSARQAHLELIRLVRYLTDTSFDHANLATMAGK